MYRFIFTAVFLYSIIFTPTTYASVEPVYSNHGIVASPEPHATKAGIDVLKKGGNAFDAAVAVGFALAVTYPAAGNLGGGGFMTAHKANGTSFFIDFREKAPKAASRDMYLDDDGNIIDGLSTNTLLASGVPGTVHGLLTVLDDHGVLNRKDVLQPSVKLAEDGFEVSYSLHRSMQSRASRLMKIPSTKKVFYSNGKAPDFGELLIQRDLAETLKLIQQNGIDGFYRGITANRVDHFMKENGGIITSDDLCNYESKYREPIVFDYKDYQLITPYLPSSGGVTLAQILKLIEPYDLQKMGLHSAEYIQTVVEAERLAYADRNYFLGDADFVDVPVKTLISDAYLNSRRNEMPREKAGNSDGVQHGKIESEETTHYCVVDQYGNVAAVTYTLNGSYGNGYVVEDAGFLLNNEMDDFSAKPGVPNMFGLTGAEANAIEPGKRMLSSMTPTIVLKDGEFAFTMGTPGGATIITTVAQIFLNMTEFGMNIREAIDAPRFHHQWQPDVIYHEAQGFSPDTLKLLQEKGYILRERGTIGIAAGIEAMENGIIAGYADSRGEGTALGH